MKIILFIILIVSSKEIFSQSNNIVVKYRMELNFGDIKMFDAILKSNDNKAVFEYSLKNNFDSITSRTDTSGNYFINIPDSLIYKIYSNRENGNQNEIIRAGVNQKVYFVTDTMQKIQWNLSNETKTIGNYICLKANTFFKGRKYTVWYTPIIPSFFGPWKFNGLNGLILEAYDETNEVRFKAINISYIKTPLNFELSNKYKKVSRNKLKQIVEEENNEFEEMLISNSSRDFKVSVKITNKNAIEID